MMTPKCWLSMVIFACLCFKKPFWINTTYALEINNNARFFYVIDHDLHEKYCL